VYGIVISVTLLIYLKTLGLLCPYIPYSSRVVLKYITVLYFEIPENLFSAVLLLSRVGRSNGVRVLVESKDNVSTTQAFKYFEKLSIEMYCTVSSTCY